jgi:hypothetical protein
MKTFFIAGRSKEFESASGQFLVNTISDSDSARDGLVSGESGGVYKASFRKVVYSLGKNNTPQSELYSDFFLLSLIIYTDGNCQAECAK